MRVEAAALAAGFLAACAAGGPAETISPARLQSALAETGGSVRQIETPFPDSHLYAPAGGQSHPGIVLLHGSGGARSGIMDLLALGYAREGFAALAFAYCGSPGTSRNLHRIELRKTLAAIEWLKASAWVVSHGVAVDGVSRGAEQALLLASIVQDDDRIGAVLGHAPSPTAFGAIDVEARQPIRGLDGRPEPAWLLDGRPVPAGSIIRVERYRGPIFLSHGTADGVWPVRFTQEIESRLREAGRAPEVMYLPGEGHVLSREAAPALFARKLAFLRAHLR